MMLSQSAGFLVASVVLISLGAGATGAAFGRATGYALGVVTGCGPDRRVCSAAADGVVAEAALDGLTKRPFDEVPPYGRIDPLPQFRFGLEAAG